MNSEITRLEAGGGLISALVTDLGLPEGLAGRDIGFGAGSSKIREQVYNAAEIRTRFVGGKFRTILTLKGEVGKDKVTAVDHSFTKVTPDGGAAYRNHLTMVEEVLAGYEAAGF